MRKSPPCRDVGRDNVIRKQKVQKPKAGMSERRAVRRGMGGGGGERREDGTIR